MRTGGSMKARAIGATLIVPFGAGLLLWPYGTLLVTVLLIVLAVLMPIIEINQLVR